MSRRVTSPGTKRWGVALTMSLIGAVGVVAAPFAQAALVPGLVADTQVPAGQVRADCADVLFLGARGSGQPISGSTNDGQSGLGPQVYQVSQRLGRDLPGRTVDVQALDYPALDTQLLLTDAAAYFAGLEQGVSTAKSDLRRQADQCPEQRIVLAGYSQGAMVMHRVLQDLSSAPDAKARSILAHLGGAVLIADGDRLPKDRTTDYGTAGRSRGVAYALRAESGVRGTRLPKRMKARVHSICNDADIVCDFRALLQSDAAGVDGATVHISSYDNSADVLKATDVVAVRLR